MDKKNEINNNEKNKFNYDNTNINININKIEKNNTSKMEVKNREPFIIDRKLSLLNYHTN